GEPDGRFIDMNIQFRSETPDDYAAIDQINAAAFASCTEGTIVRLSRDHWHRYDPNFSFVAEQDGRSIGHCMLTTCHVRLMGEWIEAAAIGPISVLPEVQKQGIGGMLLAEAH
ncbi:MAG: GNAT family N-acetyltransferase, partial [Planctomycetota bacterium]